MAALVFKINESDNWRHSLTLSRGTRVPWHPGWEPLSWTNNFLSLTRRRKNLPCDFSRPDQDIMVDSKLWFIDRYYHPLHKQPQSTTPRLICSFFFYNSEDNLNYKSIRVFLMCYNINHSFQFFFSLRRCWLSHIIKRWVVLSILKEKFLFFCDKNHFWFECWRVVDLPSAQSFSLSALFTFCSQHFFSQSRQTRF